jgi:hypothetical protein
MLLQKYMFPLHHIVVVFGRSIEVHLLDRPGIYTGVVISSSSDWIVNVVDGFGGGNLGISILRTDDGGCFFMSFDLIGEGGLFIGWRI